MIVQQRRRTPLAEQQKRAQTLHPGWPVLAEKRKAFRAAEPGGLFRVPLPHLPLTCLHICLLFSYGRTQVAMP